MSDYHTHNRGSSKDLEQNSSDFAEPNLDDLEAEYDNYKNAEQNPREKSGVVETLPPTTHQNDAKGLKNDGQTTVELYGTTSSGGVIPGYHEDTVTFKDYYDQSLSSKISFSSFRDYLISLFPVIRWIPHYNFAWLYGDVVAGVTVGCVLVPQSMSYAQIASLPAQYGLYSSFIGAFIYSFFATSKDVCIGPVAVMSLETAKVIARVTEHLPDDTEITGPVIATALSLLCGAITLGIGVLRLGFLVELISLNAVAGFMTGSAFSIITGQVPALMGYNKKVNTRDTTYKVVINTLKHLPDTKLDAVFGLIPLLILYLWKYGCNKTGPNWVDRRMNPHSPRAKFWKSFFFYAQALRNAFVIVLFTLIAWGITRHKKKHPISLLGTVPSGLKNVGVMKFPDHLATNLAPELPAAAIVLLLEHIAISKAFGRINDYKVVPDQELIAIGVTNLVGTFFNAYPATGSFSRSALKAKCNVRTPLSGVFTGACVLLALYCLTEAFYYIPKATLSAVIIHAVSDLIASYETTWNFWKMNPLDCLCFLVTVFITIFSSIENGIYFAICWSCAILLFKVAFPSGKFLGRVEVSEVINPTVREDLGVVEDFDSETINVTSSTKPKLGLSADNSSISTGPSGVRFHTKWVPLDNDYGREYNSGIVVQPPPPGVIVYRPSESWTYINCSRQYDIIFDEVKRLTRRGVVLAHTKKSDRPWNDPGQWEPPLFLKKLFKRGKHLEQELSPELERDERPVLKILAMDWSQVTQIDATGVQNLVDLRKAINKYADRQVEFHFSGIISPWIKRALVAVGFGTVNDEFADESLILGHSSYHIVKTRPQDEENHIGQGRYNISAASGTNTPFFHVEMPDFSKWSL